MKRIPPAPLQGTLKFRHELGPQPGMGFPRTFENDIIDLAPRVVCKTGCHDGWMHQLERCMGVILPPMLRAEQTHLSLLDQELIAMWAMLKFMVGEFTAQPSSPYYTQADRDDFRRTLRPTPASVIWLAQYGYGNSASLVMGRHLPDWPSPGGYVGVLQMGPLIVLLATHKGRSGIAYRAGIEEFVVQVWPPDRAQDWPPNGIFDDTAIQEFFADPAAQPVEAYFQAQNPERGVKPDSTGDN